MFFVSLGIPFIILIVEKKEYFIHRKKLIFLGPILAIFIWSSFSYLKTERIAIGTNSLTINSLGLTLASDKRFFDYYPDKSMDILFAKIKIHKKISHCSLKNIFCVQNMIIAFCKMSKNRYHSILQEPSFVRP